MLFIDQDEIREPQLTSPTLDGPTWEKIRGFSGLRDQARSEVNDYIRLYREELRLDGAHSEYAKGGWWENLAAAYEPELRSLEILQEINANPNFLPALAIGLDGQDFIPAKELDRIRRWLDRIEKEKEKLAAFYENALKRLHHDERTGGWQSLLALVSLLNGLLKACTGHRIHQSSKNADTTKGGHNYFHYVREVCEFANPDLKNSNWAIRDAVKQIVKEDRADDINNETIEELDEESSSTERSRKPRREQSWEVGTWKELLPPRKQKRKFSVMNAELGIRADVQRGDDFVKCRITPTSEGNDKPRKVAVFLPEMLETSEPQGRLRRRGRR